MTHLRIPRPQLTTYTASELSRKARRGLTEAESADTPEEQFAIAHLSALRAAAAVVDARSHQLQGQPLPKSVWGLFNLAAPEMARWVEPFCGTARKRVAAEIGVAGTITQAQADQLLADARRFVTVVADALAFGALR